MTNREFSELDADHRVAFQQTVDYAFAAKEGPTRYDGPSDTPDRLGRKFGVFEDGKLRSVCTHYDFTARVRDDWLPVAGLASVSTPPEHRRQRFVQFLIKSSLERWQGEFPIAALWPMKHSYYRQFGWALANKSVEYKCRPADLAFARDGAVGRLTRMYPDDWHKLQDVHEAHGRNRGLTLQRSENWWRDRIFQALEGGERYVYGLKREGQSVIDGYIAYTIGGTYGDSCLRVDDLAFRDHASYLGLLAFLANHDSQVDRVRIPREKETSLLDLVEEPDNVECTVTPGPQIRIVDVTQALSIIPYPGDIDSTIQFDITDEHAPWNDGVFEVRVSDGRAECQRIPEGAPAEDCASINVQTMSQLLVGTHSATEAHRYGGLDAQQEVIDTLHTLFPSQTVYLRHYF